MGDVVPFRNKRRWTRPEDYGHFPDPDDKPPRNPRQPREKSGWRWLRAWQFWVVAIAALLLWELKDPALIEPPFWLASDPETIEGPFTICAKGRSANCVVDGDTFRLGDRRIRIIGIDAPETKGARCEAEARMGEKATAGLQRLLNRGPFTMVGRFDEPVDAYGRELRVLSRTKSNGLRQSIAKEMIVSGFARAYRGGSATDWCKVALPGSTSRPAQAA